MPIWQLWHLIHSYTFYLGISLKMDLYYLFFTFLQLFYSLKFIFHVFFGRHTWVAPGTFSFPNMPICHLIPSYNFFLRNQSKNGPLLSILYIFVAFLPFKVNFSFFFWGGRILGPPGAYSFPNLNIWLLILSYIFLLGN